MSLLTFPLDRTEYSAEALGAWFAGRTRGVFAAEENYRVRANGNMTVSVSPGLAWLQKEEHWGVVVRNSEPTLLNIPAAENTQIRVDAVCLQLDKAANRSRLLIKRGTAGSNVAVPPVRNTSFDEIYLATITVSAGAVTIVAGNIADQRLNENFCGIMRDGVTGIPTQNLHNAWLAFLQASENTFNLTQAEKEAMFQALMRSNHATLEELYGEFGDFQERWETWFDTIRGALSGDTAGNLLDMINHLRSEVRSGGWLQFVQNPFDMDFIKAIGLQ